jgi:hypothetical protein
MSPTPATSWRPGDLEAIRIALGISTTRPAVEAINQAMLQLEQGYPDAIPTARIVLDQIGVLNAQLHPPARWMWCTTPPICCRWRSGW